MATLAKFFCIGSSKKTILNGKGGNRLMKKDSIPELPTFTSLNPDFNLPLNVAEESEERQKEERLDKHNDVFSS